VVSGNDLGKYGAAFTYVTDYKFFTAETKITWLLSNPNVERCLLFDYLLYKHDSSPSNLHTFKPRFGVYCPYTTNT